MSSGPGESTSGLLCSSTPNGRSRRAASCAAARERSRPIASGNTTPGKRTTLRTGRMISASAGNGREAPSRGASPAGAAAPLRGPASALTGVSLVVISSFIGFPVLRRCRIRQPSTHSLVPASNRPSGKGMRRSKKPYGISSRRTSRRDSTNGMRRSARTTSMPGSYVISMRSAATPGNATTTMISRSSSNTSTGGSHTACVRPETVRRKNCRCMRSASSNSSHACAHIQLVGLRDDMSAHRL